MAAEEAQLDLVAGVGVDLLVLVDGLEDVGGCRSIRELQLIEGVLGHLWLVALLEVFDVDLAQDVARLVVAVLEQQMRFHVLLL